MDKPLYPISGIKLLATKPFIIADFHITHIHILYLEIYCQNVVAKIESTICLLSYSILTNLQPENFNIEMNIKINLGPLHFPDNFVKEILASDSSQSYLRKEQAKKRRLVTNDLNKSAAMETIEKRIEKKSRFPISFWQDTSK